ncbi:uncharacterized protein LOC116611647 [Nematostella vectensis]|uniref:uncharacterized protein LOC116611647 n=1 Tax=Nematostella vectensis TaxID=45351 RepID=UPI00138FB1CF|nr:uncharacterized protein LOC116611647 [Nematostella vectensis]
MKSYDDIIKEQEARGFIEKVSSPDPSDHAHYIPHHHVKKESSTTPIRIVFDCSCHQAPSTPSLNDCLEVGSPYLADMGSILVRFRANPIGISTDIEKAFLHVRLSEADRDMTRFLWLSDPGDPESEFQTYRFKSVLFGSASSPFMLNAVLQTHLDNHKTPVTQDMRDNLYVDNIITGGETRVKIGDVVQIHSEKKRLKWKLGVVEDLIRGADGCVRAVTLKTAKGHTNRPISKLYPLEITTDVGETADAQTGDYGQLSIN